MKPGRRNVSRQPIITSRPREPRRMVYIQLRERLPGELTKNCPGLSIRAFDFAPMEVHRIIVRALEAEAESLGRLLRGRAILGGERPATAPAPVTPPDKRV